ncbi:hypothetical protein B0O80DRAFT_440713 [Mortierella sp. GBAus27b]|nr:hypothetical protein BGX31_004250 [Mortierella sp. GBA43]KAI8359634.1 hypothetical protein B0O80DRAFT_440713 [Mortierella sp. GBAus27b]
MWYPTGPTQNAGNGQDLPPWGSPYPNPSAPPPGYQSAPPPHQYHYAMNNATYPPMPSQGYGYTTMPVPTPVYPAFPPQQHQQRQLQPPPPDYSERRDGAYLESDELFAAQLEARLNTNDDLATHADVQEATLSSLLVKDSPRDVAPHTNRLSRASSRAVPPSSQPPPPPTPPSSASASVSKHDLQTDEEFAINLLAMDLIAQQNAPVSTPASAPTLNPKPKAPSAPLGNHTEDDENFAIQLALMERGVSFELPETRDDDNRPASQHTRPASENSRPVSQSTPPAASQHSRAVSQQSRPISQFSSAAPPVSQRTRQGSQHSRPISEYSPPPASQRSPPTSQHSREPSRDPRPPSPNYDSDSDQLLAIALSLESHKEEEEKRRRPMVEETLSAGWGSPKDKDPFRDPDPSQDRPDNRSRAPSYSCPPKDSDEVLVMRLAMETLQESLRSQLPSYDSKENSKAPAYHGHDRYSSSSSGRRTFGESNDKMPQLFLIAPPVDQSSLLGTCKPFRVIAPCQAPSILEGGEEESIHLTHHEGFHFKNPSDLVHRFRGFIRTLDAMSTLLLTSAAAAGGMAYGIQVDINNLPIRPLAGVNRMAHNRIHINQSGVRTQGYFWKQWVRDNHQIEAMMKLFESTGAADRGGNIRFDVRPIHFGGPTIWVCEECYQILSRNDPIYTDQLLGINEYTNLMRRTSEMDVVLRCSASVIVLTKTLQKHRQLSKIVIRIEPDYFQTLERLHGTQYDAIDNQFIELGKALQGQSSLKHVEIYGHAECGSVYISGLRHILKSSSLETLHIMGMPEFLQGHMFSNGTYKLQQLKLDDVHIHTEEAAKNLIAMLQANTALRVLGLSRTRLTMDTSLILESNDQAKKRFADLHQLILSHNDFGSATARNLVTMVLKESNLKRLDLSNCPGVGDRGFQEIMDLLSVRRGRRRDRLDAIVTHGTGISDITEEQMDQFRHHRS